ncbi:MAG: SurA N-terminal domain-containing protein [Pontibacterium sp.]
MLQTIRENSQGIVAKIIVGLIAVTFALFGVESLVSLTSGSNAPAEVNGEEISEYSLLESVAAQKRQILSQMGQNVDPSLLDDSLIAGMVLDRLIEEEVLRQQAVNRGMTFSTNMIDQLIVNTPAFQVDGAFNADQFRGTLRGSGLTPLTYRALIEKEKLVEQQRYGLILSSFLTDADVDQLIALDRQTRSFEYFVISREEAEKGVEVTEEEIVARYNENQADYTSEEQVVLEYVELNQLALEDEVNVTEADLQSAYASLKASFEGEELRQAAHIMVAITDDQPADEALEKAKAFKARIDAGEAFADVAKDSDDTFSAELGGDLGLNPKGSLDPAFDEVLFEMEVGQISEPVETDFGFHIITLTGIESSEVPTLEEVKAELTAEIKTDKAQALFVEQSTTLADISFSAGDLAEPAEALGLEIRTTPAATRLGSVDYVTSNPRVMEAAFSDEVLKEGLNSTVFEISPTQAVVVRVKEHLPSRPQDLAEVKDQIIAALTAEKTEVDLDASANEAVEALRKGQSMAITARVAPVTALTDATRTQEGAPREVMFNVFKMPHPQADGISVSETALANGDRAVVVLRNVTNGTTEGLSNEERMQVAQTVSVRQGQDSYREYVQSLMGQAEIERRN